MKKQFIIILLSLSPLSHIVAQNSPVKYSAAPVAGTYPGCEGFILQPGFKFAATAGKSLIFKVDQTVCKPESQEIKASTGQNYVVTITPLDETKEASFEDGKLTLDYKTRANVSIQYFDGLGRPIQTVQRGVTPDKKDLVSIQEYDGIGRESNSWLPATSSENGEYVDVSTIQKSAIALHGDQKPYSFPEYEASPLNRVLKQYGPGDSWHANKKAIETNYKTNIDKGDAKLICSLFSVDGSGSSIKVKRAGNYAAGQLYVTEVKDEDQNVSYEFKDKLGQVVLTRQIENNTNHDTYYVYDDFGNLCFVLPPLASSELTKTTGSWDETNNASVKQYAYLYKFDERNRCIRKKLPGIEWVSYVYDKADRLIFTQDGEQAKNKEWLYAIPDVFGRVVLSGICKNTDISNANYKGKLVTATFSASTTSNFGYTISGLVTALNTPKILSVNYYDNYNFINKNDFPNWGFDNKSGYGKQYTGANKGYESKGLLTGNVTALLDGSGKYLYSAIHYDYKGNIVQTKSTNHLSGIESEYLAYDFSGMPTKKEHVHTASGKATLTEQQTYNYDHAGRLTQTKHSLNGASPVLLAENSYDQLGRLASTTSISKASNALQSSYKYNVRSWVSNITNTHFNETLTYKFNGNIETMQWGQKAKVRKYTFAYDNLSRIKTGAYTTSTSGDISKYNTAYTYDMHGNIKTIARDGLIQQGAYGNVDKLTLTYSGNQLTSVVDAAPKVALSTSADFKDYSEKGSSAIKYTYNANGAMTTDLNKGIRGIIYNSLNLPQEMVINNPVARAKNYYTYTASGTKVKTEKKFDPKLQATPVIGSTAGDGALTTTIITDYTGNKIYEDGILKQILTDNGYIENGKYYFYIKDHLGNNRIVMDQGSNNIQSNEYYPFGMLFAESTNQDKQEFKYNGKELDQMHGLNQYDYSARYYDPGYSRFTTVDPMGEKKYWLSPYIYCRNNPMRFIDPDGQDEWEINNMGQVVNRIENKDLDALHMVNNDGARIEGQSLSFKYGTVNQETVFNEQKNESYNVFTINGSDNAKSVFEMVANPDKATKVEWTFSTYSGKDGNEINQVSTTHSNLREGSGTYLFNEHSMAGDRLIQTTHNHPSNIVYPSGLGEVKLSKDLLFSDGIIRATQQQFGTTPVVNLYDYKGRKYLPYNANSSTKDFPGAGSPF